MWTRFVLVTAFVLGFALPARAATTFNVSNQAMQAYLFNGGSPNPTLTLVRGQTYNFVVNTPGHPFHITTAPGIPTQDFVDAGLTNNGASTGTLTFVVPASAPATLFYQCAVHDVMTGTLSIVSAPPVPANGTYAALLLGGLALCAGFVTLRRRRAFA